jgi:carbon starvation protein
MNTVVLMALAFAGYIVAYRTYGRYIAGKILGISDKNKMPAHQFRDGVDFVPTKRSIVFGHHFTTIAGIGPIVGPAIGVIWGWLPAFLWVFFGSIFMGGVHDFATLVISARNQGKTIGDLTGNIVNNSTRYAFQFLIQFLLWMVLALFAIIVATLFVNYPASVFPVWFQIPVAVWLGWQIRRGGNELLYSIIAVALMYVSIIAGPYIEIELTFIGDPVNRKLLWGLIILIYVFFASTVPVNKLLQPRDYINSHQLIIAMVLLVTGTIIAHPAVDAPAINRVVHETDPTLPGLMPMLFITIACGAISGFHSLASSGTTVKQVNKEKDSVLIGYGGMILEGFLAVLVIIAVVGGLGKGEFYDHYSTWSKIAGGIDISPKIAAFVDGASNLLSRIGIHKEFGTVLIVVFVVSFANTTLDSATRIQRLSLQEIFRTKGGTVVRPFNSRYFATFIVVLLAAVIIYFQITAKEALRLWLMFGALNQLLAALGLGIISIYLYHKGKNYLVAFIPMLFVLTITVWAMINNVLGLMKPGVIEKKGSAILLVIAVLVLLLTLWMLVSGVRSLFMKNAKT